MDKITSFLLGVLCTSLVCGWFIGPALDRRDQLLESQEMLIKGLLDDNARLQLELTDCILDQADANEAMQDSLYEAHIKEADFCMQQAIKRVEQLSEKQ